MTLEEAIKHCEEVADTCEFEASKYDMTDAYESHVACQEGECAEEHRQLAEWLKDYKRLKEQEPCEDWYDVPSDEMTLEQARQAVRDLRKMWIEHLEQKSILDKIKAEIKKEIDRDDHADEYCDGYYDGMRNALAIIDKHKAESERK